MSIEAIYEDGAAYDRLGNAYASGSELAFYRRQVDSIHGDVLELGCGTGRLTIPLAETGKAITGLDIAPAMLAEARAKAATCGADSVTFVEGDVRSFHMVQSFGLIFFPINSLSHLHTREDIGQCFAAVQRHLFAEGRFVVDMFVPSLVLLTRDPAARYPVGSYRDADGTVVTVTESSWYDSATQINHLTWFYRREDLAEETERRFGMRQFFPQELDALLDLHGFIIENKYGDYDESLFDATSSRQLVVCVKSH